MQNLQKTAFTLVELAIVLVIIGLLTAGVVGGQSLVESSKKQKVVTDLNSYQTAIKAFQLEYDALPGDFRAASSYWPATTHIGNGDNKVTYFNESYYFWEHLSLSGVIPGSYDGSVPSPADRPPTIGTNVPKAPFEGYYIPAYLSQLSTINYELGYAGAADIYYNFIMITKPTTSYWTSPVLSPKVAKDIDRKLDDGMPTTGKYRSGVVGACGTVNGVAAEYNVASNSIVCMSGYVF